MKPSRLLAVALSVAVLVCIIQVAPASATFPGKNGRIAYVSSGDVFLVDPVHPHPLQITTIGGVIDLDFRADGRKIVIETSTGLALINPKAGTSVVPIPSTAGDHGPSFDPTGKKITYDSGGDIFISPVVDGSTRTNLTSTFANIAKRPDWSADGQFIAFQDNTAFTIVRIQPTGGAFTTLTTALTGCVSAAPCQEPSVAPDSKHVLYDQDGAPNGLYEVLSTGASKFPFQIASGNLDLPAFSPDDKAVAFQDTSSNLSTVPVDGSGTQHSLMLPAGRISWARRPT